jgi:hypothetical protein
MIKSNTALVTARNITSSLFLYLGALIGSTFGIMEMFALLMGVFEGYFEKFKAKHQKKIFSEKVFRTREIIDTLFNNRRKILRFNTKAFPETIPQSAQL